MSEQTDREWMRNRIDTIADGVADLKMSVAEIKATCPAHGETIRDLKLTVFGSGDDNSNPGLRTRVDRIETAGTLSMRFLAVVVAVTSTVASVVVWGIDHFSGK